jgi:hypothetical protein
VFLGRWTSVLRALIPGLAGLSDMPYGRFLVFSGVAWATAFTLLGYAAGASYRHVERVAGRASLVLLGLVATAVLLRWTAHRAIAHQEQIRAISSRLADTTVALGRRSLPHTTPVAGRPVRPAPVTRSGVDDGRRRADHRRLDCRSDHPGRLRPRRARAGRPRRLQLVRRPHTTVADTVSEAILAPVRWPWLVATIVAMTAAVGVWRGGRDGGRVLAGGVGAWAIVVALQQLLPTPASGAPFPATEPAVVAVLSVTLADVVGRSHGWAAGARATAVASMLVTDPSTWKPRHGAPFRYEPPRV